MEIPRPEVFLSPAQMDVVRKTVELRIAGIRKHRMDLDMTEGEQSQLERQTAGVMGEVAMRGYLGQDWREIDEGDPDGGVDIWIEFPKERRKIGVKTATRIYKEKHVVDYLQAPARCDFIVRAERLGENGISFCGYVAVERFRRRARRQWYSGKETMVLVHHPERTGVNELSPIFHLWLATRQSCELA